MMENPYRYAREKLGNAVRSLMTAAEPSLTRIAAAMGEVTIAFHGQTPSGQALEPYLKLRELMGNGPFEQRAGQLSEMQRLAFNEYLLGLLLAVERDYCTWKPEG